MPTTTVDLIGLTQTIMSNQSSRLFVTEESLPRTWLFSSILNVATHQKFRLGMPSAGVWKEVFNSDAKEFGGSGIVNTKKLSTKPVAWNGRDYSVELSVPPLGGIVLAF